MTTEEANNGGKLASVGENFALEEGLAEETPSKDGAAKSKVNRLSIVSQQYDRTGKGFLDPTEAKMREIDKSGRGYLTNDRVYDMVKEQLELQKQMVTQKRLIIGLLIFSVVLALANMGTAFAAATLAKDTTVTSGNNLASTTDGGIVGTGAAVDVVKVSHEESNARALQACDGDGNTQGCVEALMSQYRIKSSKAQEIFAECGFLGSSTSVTVKLQAGCKTFGTNTDQYVTLCNAGSGFSVSSGGEWNNYTYSLPAGQGNINVGSIEIKCDGGPHCTVTNFCPCYTPSDEFGLPADDHCNKNEQCCGCSCAASPPPGENLYCTEQACLYNAPV